MDSDDVALGFAARRSSGWARQVRFQQLDIERDLAALPTADMTLAFNIFPYLSHPERLLELVAQRGGSLAVRQYDGAALRFGPMDPALRTLLETSLRASVGASGQFRHYDMDRTYEFVSKSPFTTKKVEFELFERFAPFPPDFEDYYEGTLAWTLELLSDEAADALSKWLSDRDMDVEISYFFEVDLTAVLS